MTTYNSPTLTVQTLQSNLNRLKRDIDVCLLFLSYFLIFFLLFQIDNENKKRLNETMEEIQKKNEKLLSEIKKLIKENVCLKFLVYIVFPL